MKKKRFILIIAILFLAIGFAAVSTTLYINGSAIVSNDKDKFINDIVFDDVSTESENTALLSPTKKEITFQTKVLKSIGDEAVLDYTIKNLNSQYNAEVSVAVELDDSSNPYNDYIKITNSITDSFTLEAQGSKAGKLNVKLLKSYLGDKEIKIGFTITYTAEAAERSSVAD